MRKIAGIMIPFLFFISSLSAEEAQYTNNSFARLSYVKGDTFIQRAADLAYEEGVVNMPISEGDRLGTTDGRAEIYLGNGNYVRLDHDTKIDFLNLPKKGSELTRIRVWTGNVYFRVKFLEEEKNIEIHTSDVSFYVLDEGLYRIDVRQDRESEIFVYEGMVEAAGETGSVLINSEQKLEISSGRFISRPTRFFAVAEDSFDRWSEHRDSQIRKHLARTYLPEELEDFEHELAEYGDWAYMTPYGYVWVPGGIDPYWRPYYHGRWTWLPLCGWTWLPYEPWGWCTYHYGRWHWRFGLGWYWIPTTIWGPAWVSWYWGYDYFGWAPLSYYGYPGVIINNVYYGRYSRQYYPYNSRALTVIHKKQLKAPNVSKVALSQKSVKNLGKISLSKRRLPFRPTTSKVTIEKLDGKKLILRKTGTTASPEERKPSSRTTIRKPESVYSKSVEKKVIGRVEPSQERKIIEKKSEREGKILEKKSSTKSRGYIKKDSYGYSSSPEISTKKYSRKIKTRKSSSFISRIFKHIAGRSSKSIKSRSYQGSSKGTSSKRISSGSRSKSTSGSSSRRVSSSSSRSSSSSGKVKKKN